MKKFLLLLVLAFLGASGYVAYLWYAGDSAEQEVYAFVPEDFIFVIESDQPIQDWRGLSASDTWKILKKSPFFADISKNANSLDSLLEKNKKITELAKIGKLLISTHTTSSNNYDFLILLDLHDQGKLSNFAAILPPIFKKAGYQVTTETHYNYTIYRLFDTKSKETLHLSLVNNVLVASYTNQLVKQAIAHSGLANILTAEKFKNIYQKINQEANYSMMVNYRNMDNFIKIFTPQPSDMIMGLGQTVNASGFALNMKQSEVNFDGNTQHIDSIASYLTIFNVSGTGKIHAQNILPATTAMFTSVGFSDFKKFYGEIMSKYQKENKVEYEDLQKKLAAVEKLLNLKIEKDFFSWMEDEIVTALIPVKDSATNTSRYAYYAMFHFDQNNYEGAKAGLDHVARQIKRRTPFKFEKEEYRGFEIRYLGMKDFFELFFKKMFGKIEKPHYVFLDDYVVFSNDIPSLKYVIDEYLKENILRNNAEYKAFSQQFAGKSNIFTYLQSETFFPYLKSSLSPESQVSITENEAAVRAFRHIGFQMIPENGMFKTLFHAEVKEWAKPKTDVSPKPAPVIQPEIEDLPQTQNDSLGLE
ncbi:MAG: DUF3352 domain-containing protein [Bacteroidia bacterium]